MGLYLEYCTGYNTFEWLKSKEKKNVKILISIFKYKKRRRDNLKG